MPRLAYMIMATAALLLSPNLPRFMYAQPSSGHEQAPSNNTLPGSTNILQTKDPSQEQDSVQKSDQDQPVHDDPLAGKDLSPKMKDEPLQQNSRLELVRFVDGEFARVVAPIPAGKKGFHFKAGTPLDEQQLRMALASAGSAINPGDKAQITDLQFKDREIVVDINGGGRGKKRLRDRIHMEVGGIPTMTTSDPEAPVNTNAGATLYVDFDKQVPDMTPDELKHYLSDLLDFSKQHSAAVQWIDTLPPEIQQAITDKRAAVGMDRETVIAAIGRPDRKVREKTAEGTETEDWIYGQPPAKTIFVKFEGDKVTQVEQYPQ